MAALLEENATDYVHNNVGQKQSNIIISEAFTELGPAAILKGKRFCHICGRVLCMRGYNKKIFCVIIEVTEGVISIIY